MQEERQTDRQTDRQTVRQTDIYTDRQTVRQTDSETDRQTDRQTDRESKWGRDWESEIKRRTEKWADRHTDWLTGWLTDWLRHKEKVRKNLRCAEKPSLLMCLWIQSKLIRFFSPSYILIPELSLLAASNHSFLHYHFSIHEELSLSYFSPSYFLFDISFSVLSYFILFYFIPWTFRVRGSGVECIRCTQQKSHQRTGTYLPTYLPPVWSCSIFPTASYFKRSPCSVSYIRHHCTGKHRTYYSKACWVSWSMRKYWMGYAPSFYAFIHLLLIFSTLWFPLFSPFLSLSLSLSLPS